LFITGANKRALWLWLWLCSHISIKMLTQMIHILIKKLRSKIKHTLGYVYA